MSGHSKWATIKRKKAALDAKRGKLFTRISKEISVAARAGGDPTGNARLRLLIDKAKDANMPAENISRAIKRGTGEIAGAAYENHIYEGYGPGGIAVLVETLTDNKNRTVAEIRRLFNTKGGTLGESGSVAWMFDKMGVIQITNAHTTDEKLIDMLIDYTIHDISHDGEIYTITCDPKSLEAVKNCMQQAGLKIESAEIELVAKTQLHLSDDIAETAHAFLNELEEHDDVQNVYTNLA